MENPNLIRQRLEIIQALILIARSVFPDLDLTQLDELSEQPERLDEISKKDFISLILPIAAAVLKFNSDLKTNSHLFPSEKQSYPSDTPELDREITKVIQDLNLAFDSETRIYEGVPKSITLNVNSANWSLIIANGTMKYYRSNGASASQISIGGGQTSTTFFGGQPEAIDMYAAAEIGAPIPKIVRFGNQRMLQIGSEATYSF